MTKDAYYDTEFKKCLVLLFNNVAGTTLVV